MNLIDLIVFPLWDRAWALRPMCVNLAIRLQAREGWLALLDEPSRDRFSSRYYHIALATASPRAWRYIESRHPRILFLWRFGALRHPATERVA